MPSKISKTHRRQVVAESTSNVTGFTLPWILALGESTLRTTMELRAIGGNFGARVGFRTAAVQTTKPSAWSTSTTGTNRSTNGVFVEDIDVSSLISSAMWLQPRLEVGVTSGSGVAEALAAMRIATRRKAVVTGASGLDLQPVVNSGEDAYIPLGKPTSALDLNAMMFAFSLTGLSGSLSYSPAFRTFESSAFYAPSAWTDLATYSSVVADENRNSGVLTVAPGTNGLVQAGLRVKGTDVRGTLRVVVASRYA